MRTPGIPGVRFFGQGDREGEKGKMKAFSFKYDRLRWKGRMISVKMDKLHS